MTTGWLFGPEDGWSLEPVGRWLLGPGCDIRDARHFVEELVQRLDQAGARLDRLRISSRTLHPQLVALGASWQRGQGVELWTGEHGVEETPQYLGSPMEHVHDRGTPFRRRMEVPPEAGEHMVLHDLWAAGMRDYVALPMVFTTGTINIVTVATADPAGFSDADIARFEALARLMRPAYELINSRRTMRGLLDTYVGPRVTERITQGQVRRGDGERIEAAFWYSDLRGFTALSEALPTDEVLLLLNTYFEECAAAATPRGGEILQFIGDAILMVFEIHTRQDESRVCAAALEAGQEAFARIARINTARLAEGRRAIEFGLGLHLGTVVHANVGAPDRLSFNVVGPAVNMTARIQEMTKQTGEALLFSADFARLLQRPVRSVGRYDMRGIAKTAELFTLGDSPA